jgi:antirestriction protein ArdC
MKVNQIITDKFLDALKENVIPWQKPWKTARMQNAISGHAYNGVNALILAFFGKGIYYLTFKQACAIGAQVKKGTGLPIVYCAPYKTKDKQTDEEKTALALRYYTVFPVALAEMPKDFTPKNPVKQIDFSPIESCENLIAKQSADIEHAGNVAAYSISSHKIIMPAKESFSSVQAYYKTLFHEMIHREAKELGEELQGSMDKESYSKEELVAEIGANFLANFCGLNIEETLNNSKAYVQGWIKQLESNPQLIISASSKAQKRFDSILKRANLIEQTTIESE